MTSFNENKPLPEPVQKNIEAIIGLQVKHDRDIPIHQRLVEKIAASFGEPLFLYFQLLFFVIWGVISYVNPTALLSWHLLDLDLHQDWIGIASLFISTGVLVYQNRHIKISEQRSLFVLQMSLLTEQKLAKLIGLLEELRTDLPNVHNRLDLEAELMKQVTEPQVVLDMLQEALEQAITSDAVNDLKDSVKSEMISKKI